MNSIALPAAALASLGSIGLIAGMGEKDTGVYSEEARIQAPTDLGPGGQLYMQHCAQCHGEDLKGANGSSLVDGVWNFGGRDWDIFRNTKHGIASVGMPEYEGVLSDAEIGQILRFIKETGDSLGVERPPLVETIATRDYDLAVEAWISEDEGLDRPWGITFADDRTALITEQTGGVRIVRNGRLDPRPIEGVPQALFMNQGGMLDVAVDPDYESNGWIYLAFSHPLQPDNPRRSPAMTKIVRGKISGNRWTDEQTLFEADHDDYQASRHHYGTRIVFDNEGYLYFAIGDRGDRPRAQDLTRPNGKIHRINGDGSIPSDNPFFGQGGGVYESTWSHGHRNPQGLGFHPTTGDLWATEHGPMGGDELNLIEKGANYGWPDITYGINYNGTIITEQTHKDGMKQPAYLWIPSIAPCGMAFNDKGAFPRWKDNLFVSGLAHEVVNRLHIEDGRVIYEEPIVRALGRVRDVEFGPDGAMYVVLNSPNQVIRLTNAGRALRQ